MLKLTGYITNKKSLLDGGAFSVQLKDTEQLAEWLIYETTEGATVVVVDLKEKEQLLRHKTGIVPKISPNYKSTL